MDSTTGYVVLIGTQSRRYSRQLNVGASTTWPLSDLRPDVDYFLAVIAYDAAGTTSEPSVEIRARLSSGATTTAATSAASAGTATPPGATASSGPSVAPPSARALALEWMLRGAAPPPVSSSADALWRGLVRVIDEPLAVGAPFEPRESATAPGVEGRVLEFFATLARTAPREVQPAVGSAALVQAIAVRMARRFLPADPDEELFGWAAETAAADLDGTGRFRELVIQAWSGPPARD